MGSRKLQRALFFAASSVGGDGRSPLTEFRILSFGEQPSAHGPVVLMEEDAAAIVQLALEENAGRGGRLDIDYAHLSQTEAPNPEAHISAGSCLLEVREDGIWAVDIQYTDRARAYVTAGEYNSFSPVMAREAGTNRILGIYQLALTNIPALHGAGMLAASVTGFNRHGGLMDPEGGSWDRDAADGRLREHFGGDPGSDGFDLSGYRGCFVFYDGENPENISSFKGLVCDVDGGEVKVSRPAVEALAGVMQGARGGIDLSADDMDEGRQVVSRYYAMWEGVAPWDREETDMETSTEDMSQDQAFEGKPGESASEEAPVSIPLSPRVERYAITHGYRERMDSAYGALQMMLGDDASFYIEDMDEGAVQLCVYSEGPTLLDPSGGGEKVFEIPYTMGEDGAFSFGDPVELVKTYMPKTVAQEQVAMSTRFGVLREELQTLTGAETFSAALRQVEQWKETAAEVPDLQTAAQVSEEQRIEAERAALIKQARASGRWSKSRELAMDRSAERARKLGEDPVEDMRGYWKTQSPIIFKGPGEVSADAGTSGGGKGETLEPNRETLALSQKDEEAVRFAAAVFGRKGKEEDLARKLLDLREERERRRAL